MLRLFALLLTAAVLAGCGGALGGGGLDYKTLDAHMRAGDCPGAQGMMEQSREGYGTNRKLLYLLDAGMVNLVCGNHDESSRLFQEADILAQELWTKSISREAASFVVNDYTIPYSGEDFEKVMISLFAALDYAAKGDFEGALVEARRINSKLTQYNDAYQEKNVYSEDAFARYLSAMLYEADNPRNLQNLDSASIDYYTAYRAYGAYTRDYGTVMPRVFIEDYLRVAEAAGKLDEAGGLKDRAQWIRHKEAAGLSRVVLVHLNGKSPEKYEAGFVVQGPYGPIKIAFPAMKAMPPACKTSELVLTAQGTGTSLAAGTELVEDINRIAVKNLDDRKTRDVAKAIARAVIKQAAVNAAADQMENELAKSLMRLGGTALAAVTEVADTRSWRTLPGEIYLGRTFVPEGTYDVSVRFCGGEVRQLGTMELKSGKTKFLLVETMY